MQQLRTKHWRNVLKFDMKNAEMESNPVSLYQCFDDCKSNYGCTSFSWQLDSNHISSGLGVLKINNDLNKSHYKNLNPMNCIKVLPAISGMEGIFKRGISQGDGRILTLMALHY